MNAVATNSVAFHPLSFGDFNGRVFTFENKLYRGITACRAAFYRRIIDDGTIANLIERGLLVQTTLSDLCVEGFDLVLEHRRLPFVSYAYEWCMGMVKDAALLTLDLEIALCERGLTLQDAHPWNILFDGTKPTWVDFGSIVEARPDTLWRAYDEFCHFFLYPLLVMAEGHHRVARRLLEDSDEGVAQSEAVALTGRGKSRSILEAVGQKALSLGKTLMPSGLRGFLRHRIDQSRGHRDVSAQRPDFLRQLRDKISGIAVRTINGLGASNGDLVRRAIRETGTASALQIMYDGPPLVLDAGIDAVLISVDEHKVQSVYDIARARNARVHPLVMDFRNPSPAMGLRSQTATAAFERLACDLVIALETTHQLGVRYRLTFDQIAAGLAIFAQKAALIDFVPGDHELTRAYFNDGFTAYTPANLESALRRHFHRVQRISTARETFLCMKGGA